MLSLVTVCVLAHTPAETNQIVSAALDYVLMHGHRSWQSERRDYNPSEDPNTWQTFLRFGGETWSMDERRAAFDQYLAELGRSNLKAATEKEQIRVRTAIGRCRILDYTNSAPALVALALNSNGVYRAKAIGLALSYLPVNDATTSFVETIITNVHSYSSSERVECIWGYSRKLQASECNTPEEGRAVSMLYRNRKIDCTGAHAMDLLMVEKIFGYEHSSNRIDTAMFMLAATNARPSLVSYFTSVTNQLLSSGQPLVQLDIGEGE